MRANMGVTFRNLSKHPGYDPAAVGVTCGVRFLKFDVEENAGHKRPFSKSAAARGHSRSAHRISHSQDLKDGYRRLKDKALMRVNPSLIPTGLLCPSLPSERGFGADRVKTRG